MLKETIIRHGKHLHHQHRPPRKKAKIARISRKNRDRKKKKKKKKKKNSIEYPPSPSHITVRLRRRDTSLIGSLPVPVLRLDVVGEGLGLLVRRMVSMGMFIIYYIIRISNTKSKGNSWTIAHTAVMVIRTVVMQLDDVAALAAALNRTRTRNLEIPLAYLQPVDSV